jgi:hypothetical protein
MIGLWYLSNFLPTQIFINIGMSITEAAQSSLPILRSYPIERFRALESWSIFAVYFEKFRGPFGES